MEFHWRILPNTEGKINISSTWSLPENWAFSNAVYKASITLISVGDLRDLGDDQEKWYNHKGNNNVRFFRLCLNRIACEGLGMRPTRGLWQEGHHPEGEGGKGTPRGKGDQRGLHVYMMSLSNTVETVWVREFWKAAACSLITTKLYLIKGQQMPD